jgi:hypothetical protein
LGEWIKGAAPNNIGFTDALFLAVMLYETTASHSWI